MDTNRDTRKTIVLASTGRSGSTFVSSAINYDNTYRTIFEPFYSERMPIARSFEYPRYIRPGTENEKLKETVRKILNGGIRNRWSDYHNTKILAQKRIVKSIRANLFLKWIKDNFPETPIVLLVRNPFATVESWIRCGWKIGYQFRDRSIRQTELVEDFLNPFVDKYRSMQDHFELCMYAWCISYLIPLRQLNPEDYHLTYYENYILDPISEAKQLMAFLGRPFDQEVVDQIQQPSKTTRKDSALHFDDHLKKINHWKDAISREQVLKGHEILESFGLSNMYDDNSVPQKDVRKSIRSR